MHSFEDGKVNVLRVYPVCSDTTTYTERKYLASGHIGSESFRTPSKDHVEFKSWYENGQQSATWQEKNGKEHGNVLCWYEDGKLKKEGVLNEGRRIGIHKAWFDNGQLYALETYDSGVLSGPTKVYFPNGKINIETFYKNGKRSGNHKEWDSTGQLVKFYILDYDTLVKAIVGGDE